MKIKPFKQWFADENYVKDECNCHIGAHLDYLMSSDKTEDMDDFAEWVNRYFKYRNELKEEGDKNIIVPNKII